MKLTLTQFVTVDGVVQAPGGPEEDREGGFTQGGWLVPFVDEHMGRFMTDVFEQVDAFLLGRRTYDVFAGFWPKVEDPADPVASRLNTLPKYVASRTLERSDWAGTTVLRGDVVQEVAALKALPGRELQVHGSGGLARTLMAHGLVDEYRLLVYPVVLGAGKRLFADGALPTGLKLLSSATTGTGVSLLHYAATGRPSYGTVGE